MKTLTIVSQSKNTGTEILAQLSPIIGSTAHIQTVHFCHTPPHTLEGDLILFASQPAFESAYTSLSPDSSYLIARRAINYREIDKIFDIPPYTDVLLVNDSAVTTGETLYLLESLGINHLRYHPYTPGMTDYPRLATAITPGETELVPDCVSQVINIKTRLLDFTTLVEILKNLSLMEDKADILSSLYFADIISFIRTIKQATSLNDQLTGQFHSLIRATAEGIIAFNQEGEITMMNPAAQDFLAPSGGAILGKPVSDPTVPLWIQNCYFHSASGEETQIQTDSRTFTVISLYQKEYCLPGYSALLIIKHAPAADGTRPHKRPRNPSPPSQARYGLSHIIGNSTAITLTKNLARKIALSPSPVMIQGESGTGKEIFAQSIHNESPRRDRPFVAVNFAALTESLLESELFGYTEGAFTGAKKGGHPGLFEQAHTGTIFLDEIGDAPLSFQVKLLRVLQEKQIRRIGGWHLIPIDIRLITASNKDLKKLVRQGLFREDLYYRLNVLSLKLPPLRARKEDIPALAYHCCRRLFQQPLPYPPEEYCRHILPYFLNYEWPGNIRELQNTLEYIVSISPDAIPTVRHLPEELISPYIHTDSEGASEPEALLHAIVAVIREGQQNGQPVGRRTLALRLNIPENQVRRLLRELSAMGRIRINRGCRGLEVL